MGDDWLSSEVAAEWACRHYAWLDEDRRHMNYQMRRMHFDDHVPHMPSERKMCRDKCLGMDVEKENALRTKDKSLRCEKAFVETRAGNSIKKEICAKPKLNDFYIHPTSDTCRHLSRDETPYAERCRDAINMSRRESQDPHCLFGNLTKRH
jgi:hypothetical protein